MGRLAWEEDPPLCGTAERAGRAQCNELATRFFLEFWPSPNILVSCPGHAYFYMRLKEITWDEVKTFYVLE
jgi:hypothetical protein